MMRKSLAVLITAILASTAANAAEVYNKDSNKVDLYGKVVGLNYMSQNDKEHGDQSYARLGFKGFTQINDELIGYGQWEYNLQTNNAEASQNGNATRLGFAGLKYADFGSFDYGRNYGVLYDVAAFTDVNPEFGGDSWSRTDNFMTGRANNLATFRAKNLFARVPGLSFAAQYQGKNERDSRARTTANGDGWGISSSYEVRKGLDFAMAYAKSDRTNQQARDKNGENAEAWTAGIRYNPNQLYLAAMYAESRNMTPYGNAQFANKTQNIELVAQYQFKEIPLRPSISYLQSRGKDLNAVSNGKDTFHGGSQDLVKYIEVGTSYYFNKNMYTYIDYKINLLKKDSYARAAGANTDDVLGLGLVYQF
ncbi:MAG: porin [Rouxiella aceris]|uniref:porin n=1 Tax=Rouxiella aceris TaxID=2703884 RepID=UPI002843C0B3|nr:porin [Rouxiella aceris]MDR3431242.1 porin [Rouxiella aceris]